MQFQKNCKVIFKFLPLSILCACTQLDALNDASLELDALCDDVAQTTQLPEKVPDELLAVKADPNRFSNQTAPASTQIGTVVDSLTKLDGCWGRHYWDWDMERYEVLKFDVSQKKVTTFALVASQTLQFNPLMPVPFKTNLPFFMTEVYELAILNENTLELTKIRGEGAAIENDGKTIFFCPVSGGSVDLIEGDHLTAVATLDGDNLRYADSILSPEEIDAADLELSAGYWVRFDCP